MKKALLIGGGTGGHILPLRPLVSACQKKGISVSLVVHDAALDRTIVQENFQDIPVYFLSTGKMRRYISWRNIVDIFLIIQSIWSARTLLRTLKPDILFFKGGFVGFPFLIAGFWLYPRYKGKVFAHESDISAGEMTKFIRRHADRVFESFDEKSPSPLFYEPLQHKKGDWKTKRPKLFVFGGSQGSVFINTLVLDHIDRLCAKYEVVLVTGLGKKIDIQHDYLRQYEFLSVDDLSSFLRSCDIVVARAGANSLFEIVSAQKKSIIIPLPSVARNHQMHNAQFFEKKGLCVIAPQNKETCMRFPDIVESVLHDDQLQKTLNDSRIHNASETITYSFSSV